MRSLQSPYSASYGPANRPADVNPVAMPTSHLIEIQNPHNNQVALSYQLFVGRPTMISAWGDQQFQLVPGRVQDLDQSCAIRFDSGRSRGRVDYELSRGIYYFAPLANGSWELYQKLR
jgi:hypothetical protein